ILCSAQKRLTLATSLPIFFMLHRNKTRIGEMASKKSHTSGESAVENGAAAVNDGFEKALKTYDRFMTFSKDNAEALLKSANAAGKGLESIHSEVLAYT